MSSSSARRPVIVGLFVTLALLILAGGILTVGDLKGTFTQKITVSSTFDEVGGLQTGDNVWFSGLKVGTVRSLAFHGDSKVRAELVIDESAAAFIHNDTLAKIGSDGLIGNRIVVLFGGTTEAPTLQEGDELAVGESVSTEQIMKTLQENNTNLVAITGDIKAITARIVAGEGSVGKLLQDDGLYTSVSDAVTTLGTASENARRLTASLATFSAKLNTPGSLPNDLVTDTTTFAAITATVADLGATVASAKEMIDGLAKAAADPSTPVGTLLLDPEAGADLKVVLDNLNTSSALLEEDLKAIQSNFLFRPYFRKQEKAAAKAAREAAKAGR